MKYLFIDPDENASFVTSTEPTSFEVESAMIGVLYIVRLDDLCEIGANGQWQKIAAGSIVPGRNYHAIRK